MDEYVPKTQEIREAYRYETGGDGCSVRGDEAYPEFDRWLAAHDAQVKADALNEAADMFAITGRLEMMTWLRARAAEVRGTGTPNGESRG